MRELPRGLVWALIAAGVVLLVLGYALDQDWLVALTFVAVVGALALYALTLLGSGQREWFGRDRRRRDER